MTEEIATGDIIRIFKSSKRYIEKNYEDHEGTLRPKKGSDPLSFSTITKWNGCEYRLGKALERIFTTSFEAEHDRDRQAALAHKLEKLRVPVTYDSLAKSTSKKIAPAVSIDRPRKKAKKSKTIDSTTKQITPNGNLQRIRALDRANNKKKGAQKRTDVVTPSPKVQPTHRNHSR